MKPLLRSLLHLVGGSDTGEEHDGENGGEEDDELTSLEQQLREAYSHSTIRYLPVPYLPVPSKSDPDPNKSRSDPQHLLHQHILASKHEKYQGCRSALIFLQIWIKLVFSMRIRIKIQLLFYSNANPDQEPALKTFFFKLHFEEFCVDEKDKKIP